MTKIEKAYLAGLFDGEGSCNIGSAGASILSLLAKKSIYIKQYFKSNYLT